MSSHRIFPYPFWTIPEPLVPDIIPVYFISFLRLATEQHSTLLQKGGINGKVYLLNKMNNFTSSRPRLWLKSSRNCSGGWRGLVGGFSYYIKIFCQIYFIKIYIWKRGKPKSAKHRRILMPIWFHSLTILPGSAAGAAALKYTYTVCMHACLSVCMYVYMSVVCLSVCLSVCMYIYIL